VPGPYTVQQLINYSLKTIGVIATGETPTADQSTDALLALNLMFDEWGGHNITARATTEITYILNAGTYSHQIGPTATGPNAVVTSRPMSVVAANIVYPPPQNVTLPVTIIGVTRLYQHSDRFVLIGPPEEMFYDPQMPNGVIYWYPIPDISYNIFLRVNVALAEMSNLSTDFTLEPTYFEAIVFNLAKRLFPMFGGSRPVPQHIEEIAKRSYDNLEVLSAPSMFITSDGIVDKTARANNIITYS